MNPNLLPWQYEALHLLAQGHAKREVARLMKVSAQMLTKLMMRTDAQREMARIHELNVSTIALTQTDIQIHVPRAVANIIAQMDHPNPDVAFRANRWLAEAGGHTPLRRVEVTRTVRDEGEFEAMTFEELQARALEGIKQAAIETTAVPAKEDMN